MSIRVFLSDNQEIFRQCLYKNLNAEKDIDVVGESGNGPDSFNLIKRNKPDIIITEIILDGYDGIELVKGIYRDNLGIKIITLTHNNDQEYLTKMIQAGASGYLLKTCPYLELITAISIVYKGNFYICSEIAGPLLNEYYTNKNINCFYNVKNLSSREREVLYHIIQGKTLKEISSELYIDYETVKTHKKHIMEKLCIYNTAELMKINLPYQLLHPKTKALD